jgi:hypothetical protein
VLFLRQNANSTQSLGGGREAQTGDDGVVLACLGGRSEEARGGGEVPSLAPVRGHGTLHNISLRMSVRRDSLESGRYDNCSTLHADPGT